MDPRTFADSLVKIADKFNTSHSNLQHLVMKICILSFKYIDKEALWNHLFPSDYVDWELVKQQKENVLGGSMLWITLLDMMCWKHLEKNEGEILIKVPMLVALRKHIREVTLDPGGGDGWTMVAKLKMLMMIFSLPTLKSLDMFTCNVFKSNTTQQCMQLLSLQSEHLYTPQEQLECMQFLLERSQINTMLLEQNLAISKAVKEDTKISLQMSRLQVVQGRPRLRDRLQKIANKSDEVFNSWETYTGFCYKHQFPPTLSEAIKTKLYFLASQTKWNWREHLHKVAPGSNIIVAKVSDYAVNQPDVPVLIRVIENLTMEGRAPFGALNHFRAQCFQSFPISHVSKMTVTQFLHLYVTVYQQPAVWKDIWKHFIGVISVQIIRDCESYVQENSFDDQAFIPLLCVGI